jgi:hypothetical protein
MNECFCIHAGKEAAELAVVASPWSVQPTAPFAPGGAGDRGEGRYESGVTESGVTDEPLLHGEQRMAGGHVHPGE